MTKVDGMCVWMNEQNVWMENHNVVLFLNEKKRLRTSMLNNTKVFIKLAPKIKILEKTMKYHKLFP